jgi:hypothetical protein
MCITRGGSSASSVNPGVHWIGVCMNSTVMTLLTQRIESQSLDRPVRTIVIVLSVNIGC